MLTGMQCLQESGIYHQMCIRDRRVGDWVATPRHGKPVEINALWYNALCTMDMLQAKFGDNDDSYRQLALSLIHIYPYRIYPKIPFEASFL